ncbi:hypothetical protein AgCh_032215 [Apium graveolens]
MQSRIICESLNTSLFAPEWKCCIFLIPPRGYHIPIVSVNPCASGPSGFIDPKTYLTIKSVIAPRNMRADFDEEAEIVPNPEEQKILRRLRAEKMAKEKGKSKEDDEAETQGHKATKGGIGTGGEGN